MKKILTYIAGATLLMPILASCSSDDKDEDAGTIWDKYEEYREANLTWIAEQETRLNPDGTKYYERLQPAWNVNSYILIHWFNAQGLQHFDGLSYTALADLQFFGNLNFRGQYISGTELALHDHFFDGINHLSGKTFLWIALLFANLHTNNSSQADTLCKKWPCIKYKANWPAQSIKNFQLLLYHVRLYYTTILFANC